MHAELPTLLCATILTFTKGPRGTFITTQTSCSWATAAALLWAGRASRTTNCVLWALLTARTAVILRAARAAAGAQHDAGVSSPHTPQASLVADSTAFCLHVVWLAGLPPRARRALSTKLSSIACTQTQHSSCQTQPQGSVFKHESCCTNKLLVCQRPDSLDSTILLAVNCCAHSQQGMRPVTSCMQ
jgi:hypothetical protein